LGACKPAKEPAGIRPAVRPSAIWRRFCLDLLPHLTRSSEPQWRFLSNNEVNPFVLAPAVHKDVGNDKGVALGRPIRALQAQQQASRPKLLTLPRRGRLKLPCIESVSPCGGSRGKKARIGGGGSAFPALKRGTCFMASLPGRPTLRAHAWHGEIRKRCG